jgi:nitroreductase
MTRYDLPISYDKSILPIIRVRHSVRTYQPFPVPEKDKKILMNTMQTVSSDGQRFAWFERPPGDTLVERLGTYGVIKGAHTFFVGVLPKGGKDDKDAAVKFGWRFEQVILKATELGLGTCWLGGTFNPRTFARDINLQDDEQIVMVSPVGFAADSKHFIDEVTTQVADSSSRLPWDSIYFTQYHDQPLSEAEAGVYAQPLEMVRLAPSAVNTQPWRVLRDARGFHFYGMDIRYYGIRRIDFLRNNDMGIALSHFALACRELELAGMWQELDPIDEYGDLTYFVSWVIT